MGEPAPSPLECGDELGHLQAAIERARSGTGSLALIEGPAGIGKTSMLVAARDLARQSGIQLLEARARLLEAELPWNVVRQLFRQVITASYQKLGIDSRGKLGGALGELAAAV